MANSRQKHQTRQALIVLGMHRSGTSALAGVLAKLGAQAPHTLMPATQDNPRGYWESSKIMQFNDAILASAGTSWDDWDGFNKQWADSAVGRELMASLPALLDQEFAGAPLFLLKDPRMCRLLPVWLAMLGKLGIEAKIVIPFRHPLEVASSLSARDGIPWSQAQLIWLRHVLDAESASRGQKRVIVRFSDLMEDWRSQVQLIANQLDIKWPRMSGIAQAEVDAYLSADLRHHAFMEDGLPDSSPIASWVSAAYAALGALSPSGEDVAARRELDAIHAELDRVAEICAPVVYEIRRGADDKVASIEQSLSHASIEVDELKLKNGLLRQEVVANYDLAMKHKASLDDMREQLGNRESAHVALVARYESGRDELARVQGEHAEAAKAWATTQEGHMSVVSSFQEKVAALESALAENREVASASQETCSSLKAALAAAGSASDEEKQERERLHSEIRTLRNEKTAIEEAAQERTSEIVIFTRRLVELEDKLSLREESLRKLSSELNQMRTKANERDVLVGKQAGALREQEARTQALLAELDVHSRVVSEYRRELDAISRSSRWTLPGRLRKAAEGAIHVPPTERTAQAEGSLLQKSGLFDAAWYLRRYPDVQKRQMDPVKHYLRYGAGEGRDPGPAFSTSGYRARYPDVAEAGINPLIHYIVHGRKEGRSIAAHEPENKEDMKHARQD